MGAEYNKDEDTMKVLYSFYALHGAPISLNIALNSFLNGYEVSVKSKPLQNHAEVTEEISEFYICAIWFFIFPIGEAQKI